MSSTAEIRPLRTAAAPAAVGVWAAFPAAPGGATLVAPLRAPTGDRETQLGVGGLSAPSAAFLSVTLGTGQALTMPLAAALARGLVTVGADGRVHPTLAGRSARIRVAEAHRSATLGTEAASTSAPATPVQPLTSTPAQPPAPGTQTVGKESGAKEPKKASAQMVDIGRAAMFANGILKIAKGPGVPPPLSLYFFANSANKYSGGKLLPQFIQKGPVRDIIDFSLVGKMWAGSMKLLPEATRTLRSSYAARSQAARGAGLLGQAKAAGGAFFAAMPEPAAAAGAAAKAGRANVPALNKLFPLIKPLTKLAFTMYAASSIVALPEYLREKGTSGLLNTRSGRSALLGAIDGVMMIPVLYAPPSPFVAYADAISMSAWMLGMINDKGWLDSIFGGDPMPPASPPAVPGATNATPLAVGPAGPGTPATAGFKGAAPSPAVQAAIAGAVAAAAGAAAQVSRIESARQTAPRRSRTRP